MPYKIKSVVSKIGNLTFKQATNNNNKSNVSNFVPQAPPIEYLLEDLILNKSKAKLPF